MSDINYFKHSLNHTFITHRPFYIMWMPMFMSCYQKLKNAVWPGKEMDWSVGMIEQGKMLWRGRIWVATSTGEWDRQLEWEFTAVEIIWAYSQMKTVYPQIMKENPHAKEYYTLYLTDPNETKKEENKTWILFR